MNNLLRNLINKESLKEFLEKEYPFNITSIRIGPRGFVAETFIIETEEKEIFFVKAAHREGSARCIEEGLPVIHELYNLGYTQIPHPILTNSGLFFVDFDDHIVVVFNYIDGEWSFKCDFSQVVSLMANLHSLSIQVKQPLPNEKFILLKADAYQKHFKDILELKTQDPTLSKLAVLIRSKENHLKKTWELFQSYISEIQSLQLPSVITHGDIMCNTIDGTDGKVYIVDWDYIVSAPAERDNWFLLDPSTRSKFLNIYHTIIPDYSPNETAYRYYLLWRYFDDIEGFLNEILNTEDDIHKKRNLTELHDLFKWLDPAVTQILHKH